MLRLSIFRSEILVSLHFLEQDNCSQNAQTTSMPAPNGLCLKVLKMFEHRGENFKIIYGQHRAKGHERLLVLDSSFNPPHMGHYTLIKKALNFYQKTNEKLHVLLLLSVNNADKTPKPASFDKRMDMMCLMADMLAEESVEASVAITTFGKFVDKSSAIHGEFGSQVSIVYLVGFDTIIRIFDPKYYAPLLPAQALESFMLNTEFYCLTRGTEVETLEQLHYSKEIRDGKYEPIIPKSWYDKVHVGKNVEKYASVSSSAIRDLFYTSPESVRNEIPSRISAYIKEQYPNSNIFL